MTKQARMTNDEKAARTRLQQGASDFGLRHSFVIRHSDFII
jgi:hypothetical protein